MPPTPSTEISSPTVCRFPAHSDQRRCSPIREQARRLVRERPLAPQSRRTRWRARPTARCRFQVEQGQEGGHHQHRRKDAASEEVCAPHTRFLGLTAGEVREPTGHSQPAGQDQHGQQCPACKHDDEVDVLLQGRRPEDAHSRRSAGERRPKRLRKKHEGAPAKPTLEGSGRSRSLEDVIETHPSEQSRTEALKNAGYQKCCDSTRPAPRAWGRRTQQSTKRSGHLA